jgi:ADP-dependent NAD(P)H-hydrate dehydratase
MTRGAVDIDEHLLRTWALPSPDAQGDKESRGSVLVVAGSRQLPGAAILAAVAALRAGAGKVRIATPASVAMAIGAAVPESRVIALPETADGEVSVDAADILADWLRRSDAVLVGPGFVDEGLADGLVQRLLPVVRSVPLVLDAAALCAVKTGVGDASVLITPHAGEMAALSGGDKEDIRSDPQRAALECASRFAVVVALKGPVTFIATPEGACWRHEGGNVGLATSGSGDVLAGLIAGLAARGASLAQAAAWGVSLHARAGDLLAQRVGPIGYLARELSAEIPQLMHALRRGAER